MLVLKMIVLLGVFAVMLYFAGQNTEIVQLHFGAYETIPAPMHLVVIVSVTAGMVVALIIGFFDRIKLRSQVRALKKDKKRIEGELSSLRKMPIVEAQEPASLATPDEEESVKGSA